LHQTVSCLTNLVSPCLLGINVRHAPERMCDGSKQFVRDEVPACSLLVRTRWG
jgi:hypothetical protein